MARSETILSVFVASPSDVSEERDRLESIIEEFNSIHARRTGIRLELLSGERDASPGFAEDAQAVINAEIPQDYDIFVGIFWNRIGSPTKRAESGTVEEFHLAKARHDKDANSVRLMLYFKSASPLTMDSFDPDQYKSVRDFRSQVHEAGCYYGEFATPNDFTNTVRIDLTRFVLDWQKDLHDVDGKQPDSVEVQPITCGDESVAETVDELDDGIFELNEMFEEELAELDAVVGRLGEAIIDVGGSMEKRTKELTSLQIPDNAKALSPQKKQKLRADAKRVLRLAAVDMDRFVDRMKPELPLFRQHLDQGIDAFTKAVPIYIEMGEEKTELKGAISAMLESMEGAIVSMEGFHGAIHGLPRLTTSLVRSRGETEKVLQEVIEIMRGGKTSLEGVLSMLP